MTTQKRQAKEAKELEKLEKQIAKVLVVRIPAKLSTPKQSGETAATLAKRKELEAKSAAAQVKGSVFYKVTVKVSSCAHIGVCWQVCIVF